MQGSSASVSRPKPDDARRNSVKLRYLDALNLIERLHHRLLEVIKDDFERHGEPEVNPVQALLIYNIADAELTAGELKSRGHYHGSNVSYNLKRLVETGYVHHERSAADRRSVRIRLTEKGQAVRARVDALYNRQMLAVEQVVGLGPDELDHINKALSRLERYWTDQILYRL
ncbi:transcriptional regulator LdtR [Aestuariivirga sp.]|uniref:transcriptional regulator LdtR n=1 Tax=Aestuariivirga sp. TaxID=2650926 RepID=UPI0037836616